MENQQYLSLADLGNIDTTDMKALTSRVPAAGLYVVLGEEVTTTTTVTDDKPPLHRYAFKVSVLEAEPIDTNIDGETLIGRNLVDSKTLWPDSIEEEIQYMMGDFDRVGLGTDGLMGVPSEGIPGWVDGFIGAKMVWKVVHRTKNGDVRAYITWMPFVEE